MLNGQQERVLGTDGSQSEHQHILGLLPREKALCPLQERRRIRVPSYDAISHLAARCKPRLELPVAEALLQARVRSGDAGHGHSERGTR